MRRLKNIILTNLSVFHQNKEWVWQKNYISVETIVKANLGALVLVDLRLFVALFAPS